MLKQQLSEINWVDFTLNSIAIIVSIFITFAIQDMIDDYNMKQDVISGLNLVIEELNTCKDDLEGCAATMDRQAQAAAYFLRNINSLDKCPEDSLFNYGWSLINPSVLTLSKEAVDMIKSTDVFQAINNDELSLSILRAYDICEALQEVFNDSEGLMSGLLAKACKTDEITQIDGWKSVLDFQKMMRDEDVRAVLVQVCMASGKTITRGFPFIDEALDKIDEYLAKN